MRIWIKTISCLFLLVYGHQSYALNKPKLVVTIVIDQMRWDYLHRYQERYSEGGFKKLLSKGYSFDNTYINYLPSMTAVGHASIYTGSIPAIHGIIGNEWPDQHSNTMIYCTADSTTSLVGAGQQQSGMSPRNLIATTITDELGISNNFQSKVIAVSLKDRAAVLPGGHRPTGAYWYDDKSGNMVSSSWYTKELPLWIKEFNKEGLADQLLSAPWETLYPLQTYSKSTADDVQWERPFKGSRSASFPHMVNQLYQNDKGILRNTPMGNTFILSLAKRAVEKCELGAGSYTDMLTINLASTDYVGHQFGPNSVEIEDTYLRLDKDLNSFFTFLDKKLGSDEYLVMLTADHGSSHAIKYFESLQFPSGWTKAREKLQDLNMLLENRYKAGNLVKSLYNYQVYFDLSKIKMLQLDLNAVKSTTIQYLKDADGIQFVADMEQVSSASIPESIKEMLINGYNQKRSGQIAIVPEPGWFDGPSFGTTHGTWNPDDTHIPLIFMGWKIKQGSSVQKAAITDIAPTLSSFLNIQVPNGSIGTVLNVELKK